MKTTYKSVQIIASVIGSKSRKAMFLVQPESIDGSKIYKNTWIPVQWNETDAREHRYTNKRYGIHNQLLEVSKYYNFPDEGRLLITEHGPVDSFGQYVRIDGVETHTIKQKQTRIEWSHYSQSYVELPMSQVTPSMLVDLHDKRNVSNIKHRIINGQNKSYLQLEERILINVPTWMMRNFEVKYKRQDIAVDDLFHNDDEFYGVAESQSEHLNTGLQEYLQDRSQSTYSLQFMDTELTSIQQWELDNPEYLSYD